MLTSVATEPAPRKTVVRPRLVFGGKKAKEELSMSG